MEARAGFSVFAQSSRCVFQLRNALTIARSSAAPAAGGSRSSRESWRVSESVAVLEGSSQPASTCGKTTWGGGGGGVSVGRWTLNTKPEASASVPWPFVSAALADLDLVTPRLTAGCTG